MKAPGITVQDSDRLTLGWCAACGLSYEILKGHGRHDGQGSVWRWLWHHTGFFGRCPARTYEIGELELTVGGDVVQH